MTIEREREYESVGPSVLEPQGSTGLDSSSGRIAADFLRELNGAEGYKRYNEMRLNSPLIGSLSLGIRMAIGGVDWYYESDIDNDPRIEFLEEARQMLSGGWRKHINEALTAIIFGFCPFAIQYRRDGSRILWDEFTMLKQDTVMRWIFDDNQRYIHFLQQWPHIWPEPIDMRRIINYRVEVEGNNPEGRSILRPAWIPYYYAKNLTSVEAIGLERNSAGLPVIKAPMTADMRTGSTDRDTAEKVVRNIRVDEQSGIVLPFGWELDAYAPPANTFASTIGDTIKRHESRMMVAAHAQFLLLGQDRVGTQALATNQNDFFSMSVDTFADMIAETHTEQAARRLLRLNGFDDEDIRMSHSPAGNVDIKAIVEALGMAVEKGLIEVTPQDEQHVRALAQLPEIPLEDLEARAADRAAQKQANQERMAQLAEMARNQPPQQQRPMMDEGEDDMSADIWGDWFNAAPPDDRRRQRYEKQLTGSLGDYFSGLRKRVTGGMKAAASPMRFDASDFKKELLRMAQDGEDGGFFMISPTGIKRVDNPVNVNVTMPPQTFNVQQPAGKFDIHIPQAQNVVNVPEQPAPRVEVHAADMPAPVVNVTVPEQAAPQVTVNNQPADVTVNVPQQAAPVVKVTNEVKLPQRVTDKTTVRRNDKGDIIGADTVTEFSD